MEQELATLRQQNTQYIKRIENLNTRIARLEEPRCPIQQQPVQQSPIIIPACPQIPACPKCPQCPVIDYNQYILKTEAHRACPPQKTCPLPKPCPPEKICPRQCLQKQCPSAKPTKPCPQQKTINDFPIETHRDFIPPTYFSPSASVYNHDYSS